MANVVGPGAAQQIPVAPDPTLQGANQFEYVTILNPLPTDFQVMVAQDVPVDSMPDIKNATAMTTGHADLVRNYGVDLRNPDHQGKRNVYNMAVIPAGETMNFRGNEAQVAVRQLVTHILQVEGKTRLMHDPHVRKEVEDRIILGRGPIQSLMDNALVTPQAQITEALNKSNEKITQPFPGLEEVESRGDSPDLTDSQSAREREVANSKAGGSKKTA